MKSVIVKAVTITLSLLIADLSAVQAAPVMPTVVVGDSDVIAVAKTKKRKQPATWHKTRRGDGRLEGRVADIDRREGRKTRHVQRKGKPVGRVTARERQRHSDEFNRFMLGLAGAALGMSGGLGGGSSGGCGIDVSTPNPTGCGTRYTDSGGSNGLRPPYQCIVNGRTITTTTFRAGCWMVRQNNTRIPMR